jgi:hypothetical protein
MAPAAVLSAIVLAGCGSSHHAPVASTAKTPGARAHPHAIEPAAGIQAPSLASPGSAPVGDPHAHAPPLAQVKRELAQLNRCGGAITAAEAQPFFNTGKSGPGFIADPGTIQNVGLLPELTAQLNALAKALKVTIYGISGYRTPAHSVAVGGFADDPHTKGEAEDIGVNSLLRSSAAQITEAQLVRFGLYRPFDPSDDPNNTEVNHIQLIPAGGLPTVSQAGTLVPDPACR